GVYSFPTLYSSPLSQSSFSFCHLDHPILCGFSSKDDRLHASLLACGNDVATCCSVPACSYPRRRSVCDLGPGQLTRPDLFIENDAHHTFTVNYFRNTCIDPPMEEGGRLEARLTGFRGGEGILELAQRKGQNPKLLAIMTGLQENRNFHLIYAPEVELSSCYKAGLLKENQGKKLITVDSDNRGMAIQASARTVESYHGQRSTSTSSTMPSSIRVILVIEAGTSNVVDCGKLQIHGNVSDWQRAMNGSPTTLRVAVTYFVAVVVALLIFA
ncbi:hypothetical protein OSTOST_15415, partial [Ostertagia ostertagi]